MEVGVFAQGDYHAQDYAVLKEIDKVEQYLQDIPTIKSVNSITSMYKSINQASNSNKASAYTLPSTDRRFKQAEKLVSRLPDSSTNILVSKDGKKARITTRILDIG